MKPRRSRTKRACTMPMPSTLATPPAPRILPRILTRSLPGSDDGVGLAQCVHSSGPSQTWPKIGTAGASACQWSIGTPERARAEAPTCLSIQPGKSAVAAVNCPSVWRSWLPIHQPWVVVACGNASSWCHGGMGNVASWTLGASTKRVPSPWTLCSCSGL